LSESARAVPAGNDVVRGAAGLVLSVAIGWAAVHIARDPRVKAVVSPELRMVEQVESVETKFQAKPLFDGPVFGELDVNIHLVWAGAQTARGRAKGPN